MSAKGSDDPSSSQVKQPSPQKEVSPTEERRLAKLTRRLGDQWGRWLIGSVVALLFLWVISPFIVAMTMGAVLAILFQPAMRRMQKLHCPTFVAAVVVTFSVTVLLILPTGYILFSAAVTGAQEFSNMQRLMAMPDGSQANLIEALAKKPTAQSVLTYVEYLFNVPEAEVIDNLVRIVKTMAAKVAELAGEVVAALPSIMVSLTVTVVSMFFLLLDGQQLITVMRRYSTLSVHHTERLMLTFGVMARSVILATVVSAALQTTVFSMTCLSLGVDHVALITLAVFIASFFPLVGSTIVTFPVAGYYFLIGQGGTGLLLLVVGLLITLLDNIVRPAVLRGSGNLHPLLAFVAAIGGIKVLGMAGIFLGPIIAGVFVVMAKILLDPQGRLARRASAL